MNALAWLHCVRKGTARKVMQSNERAATKPRGGGIAEMQRKERPCIHTYIHISISFLYKKILLQNAKRSLRTAAASRGQSTLPSNGTGAKASRKRTRFVLRARRSELCGPWSRSTMHFVSGRTSW
jgi:hypothetical protein